MMELKNILEDIVFDLIDNLDEVKNGEIDKNQKKEMAAYVLNRMKPMYITSNKGFNNLIVKYRNDPQFTADIMLRISEALKVVKKVSPKSEVYNNFEKDKFYYVFPKIYGKIISARDLMPIENAVVTLLIDNEIAGNLFELWRNPTEIAPVDEGIFSFAPRPILAESSDKKRDFLITISIKYDSKNYEKVIHYEAEPSLLNVNLHDYHENVIQVEDIYVTF